MTDSGKPMQGSSPQVRARRMRELREWYRLPREAFVPYGIATTSMQNWETVRYESGLTTKGAKRLVQAYLAMGIPVTEEWLMYGVGASPFPAAKINESSIVGAVPIVEEAKIAQELRLFHQLNMNAVDLIVPDDAMSPVFLSGDWVAGIRYFDDNIEKTVGYLCIVQTLDGHVLVRELRQGSEKNRYLLATVDSKVPEISDVLLFSSAPVIWVRRKSPI